MTDREKELEMVLQMLVQKIGNEREARRLAKAAEIAYVTEYDADRTTVANLRATLRAAKARLRHDEHITDGAIEVAVSVLDAASLPQIERVA